MGARYSELSFFFLTIPRPTRTTLFPYTTLFRSGEHRGQDANAVHDRETAHRARAERKQRQPGDQRGEDRKSTRELQSRRDIVCRLLLEKKKKKTAEKDRQQLHKLRFRSKIRGHH